MRSQQSIQVQHLGRSQGGNISVLLVLLKFSDTKCMHLPCLHLQETTRGISMTSLQISQHDITIVADHVGQQHSSFYCTSSHFQADRFVPHLDQFCGLFPTHFLIWNLC